MKRSRFFLAVLLLFPLVFASANPIYSPTWGFHLDLPEGYELSAGDKKNSFAFNSSFGASLDILVSADEPSAAAVAGRVEKALSSRGKRDSFTYNNREAVLMELRFGEGQNTMTGWALVLELESSASREALYRSGNSAAPPGAKEAAGPHTRAFLAALAYGPARPELRSLHLSALDSIEAGEGDHRLPGAITEFFYPRGKWVTRALANSKESARFRENDEAAAESVVNREFEVMKLYLESPLWQEAWKRFYRAIFKDSFDRLKDAAFLMERSWNSAPAAMSGANAAGAPGGGGTAGGMGRAGAVSARAEEAAELGKRSAAAYSTAARALAWVQGFTYERDLMGNDFVNLVTAAREGRGDCDSRALLWAVVLAQANIPSGIMVSREYSHALGLADVEGQGARFPMKDGNGKNIRWLVAETTAPVAIGLIGETVSQVDKWIGITFE